MGKARISVIIATWNASGTLNRCLKSISIQKTPEIEVIVVDGGSKDGTVQILNNSIGVVDRWISEPDKGIYDAWNKGISLSNGDWIAFVGADDILLPNAVSNWESFLESATLDNVDYVCARNRWVDSSGKLIREIGAPWVWSEVRLRTKFAHVASLHRRKLFEDVGLYSLKYRICGDTELLIRKKDKLISVFLDSVIAEMQIGGASFSVRAIKESYSIRRAHGVISPVFSLIMQNWAIILFYRRKFLQIFSK